MSLIPQMTIDQLKEIVNSPDAEARLKHSPCSEIVDKDGEYIGALVVPMTDFVKLQTEYLGQLSNSVMPKEEYQEVTEKPEFVCDVCGKACKNAIGLSGHKTSHKVAVGV